MVLRYIESVVSIWEMDFIQTEGKSEKSHLLFFYSFDIFMVYILFFIFQKIH